MGGVPGAPGMGNPYAALPPSHRKRSVVAPVLLSILAVVVLGAAVVGGLALARHKTSDEPSSVAPVVTMPTTTTTEPIPSWAVEGSSGETPSMQAVALVCGGIPFPGRLATKARKGTRSIVYWWKTDIENADTDFIQGGGIVPGPKRVENFQRVHTVSAISRWAPVGWVACVSIADRGEGSSHSYCDQQYSFPNGLFPGQQPTCSAPRTITWYGHSTWKVEIRETATGKKLKEGFVVATGAAPQTIYFDPSTGPAAEQGPQPTEDQIDGVVHGTLG